MWLKKKLVAETLDELEVIYLSWDRCRAWNAQRHKDAPIMFSGWYWVNGRAESGPFKSRSAAIRDGWYHHISGGSPPGLRAVNRIENQKKASTNEQ